MEPMQLIRVYKSQMMREILEELKKLTFEKTIIFIYGEKGTEKDYIVKFILAQINHPEIIKVPEEIHKKTSFRQESIVYVIKNFENIDFSFVFNPEKSFKCAIFISDYDYVELYKNGAIPFELYENLLSSRKIYIPPLRERKQDIIPLANFFLQEISECLNLHKKELSKEAQEAILEYPWIENAYQLKQYLAKACIMAKHQRLTSKDLFGEYNDQLSIKNFLELKIGNLLKEFANIENSNLYETVIQEVEKALFFLAINETGGNQLKAARILGINRNTLNKKLKHYNLI